MPDPEPFVDLADGRLGFETRGDGPLIIAFPGMGDLRQNYRFVGPAIADEGFRFVAADLRGHGTSSVGWPTYSEEAIATDFVSVAERMSPGQKAVIVGNSISGGAAVVAAARRPELFSGVILLSPFARPQHQNLMQRGSIWAVGHAPFGRQLWDSYIPSLYAGRKPDDFDQYLAAVKANLAEPGRFEAVAEMTREHHETAGAALARVEVPTLLIMGALDPDFPDPAAEAHALADEIPAPTRIVVVPEAGHYPHAQRPDLVTPAMLGFLRADVERSGTLS